MEKITYRVTWWPTDDAPASMDAGGNQRRRTTDVMIVKGETTFADIPKIIAVRRSGNPSNAQFVHVFAVIQIEGAM